MELYINLGRFLDSLGSMIYEYINPECNATQTAFTGERHMDWNEHVFLVLSWSVGLAA